MSNSRGVVIAAIVLVSLTESSADLALASPPVVQAQDVAVSGNSNPPDANAADQIPQRTNFGGKLTPGFSTVNGAPHRRSSHLDVAV